MATQEEFNKAVEDVKNLKSTPTNNDLLELYGLYKQSTIGDCNTAKPGLLDFKGKMKWEAWNNLKGTSTNDAMASYVKKVKTLIDNHDIKA